MVTGDKIAGSTLEEYKSLRQQIVQQMNLVIAVFTGSVAISALLLGYAVQLFGSLTKTDSASAPADPLGIAPYVFLSPLIIIIPVSYLLVYLREEIFLIGLYIKTVLEDGVYLKYETLLDRFRNTVKHIESFTPIFFTYWTLFGVCVLLYYSALVARNSWTHAHLLAPLSTGVLLLIATFLYIRVPTAKRRSAYERSWQSILGKKETGVEGRGPPVGKE